MYTTHKQAQTAINVHSTCMYIFIKVKWNITRIHLLYIQVYNYILVMF